MRSTGRAGSRYSQSVIAPLDASRLHAQPAERPALVGHRNKEARRQPIRRRDLASDQRNLSAESHRADADAVGFVHDFGFELGQLRDRIHIVERAEKLLLGQIVAVRAIAADAHAQRSRRASLPLRLPHGVQEAFAHAFQVAVGAAQMIQLAGQRILDVLVLAAAALEDQLHFDFVLLPLLEMNHRSFGAQIVAGVFAGERIDRIGAQLAASRRFRNGRANRLAAARSDSRPPAYAR